MSVFDIIMTLFTGGFWLIWVLIRNNRRSKKIKKNTKRIMKRLDE